MKNKNKKNTVFMPKSKEKNQLKVQYENIIKSIPYPYYLEKQVDKKDMIETRWRFLKINNKNVVEISRKKPNEQREYLTNNTNSDWVKKDVDSVYDNFVIEKYYYYSKE